jgi:transcriptional regulator with XRE-family HTH domain
MKTAFSGERDTLFGQMIATLRTEIGLTQTELAERLGVSRRAIGGWEAGDSYPKVKHLKIFIELVVQHRVFAEGREQQEIRKLWKAAHQRVLLDEVWVQALRSLMS